MSYRNIFYNNKEKCVTVFSWDEDGKRIQYNASHEPYLYIEGGGDAESIFGTKLIKKKFDTQYDRYKFIKDSGIKRLFENLAPHQQYLIDAFWKVNETPEFSKNPIKVVFLDIEVYAPDAFPVATLAKETINVITVHDSITNKFYTWGLGNFVNDDKDVVYVHCKNERELLIKFIEWIETDYPDILSGWNSESFDIPYLINRITMILGDEYVARLSPSGRIYNRTIKDAFGQDAIRWYIEGISIIDFLDVYKRFSPGQKESYKLTNIAETELGEKKVDTGGSNLAELSMKDWQLFVKYNIHDVRLLIKLESKLNFIGLVRMLAYAGLTTFEGAMGTLSIVVGATAIRARFRNQRIPTFDRSSDVMTDKNPGAFVAEPLKGFQKNIISFDANSLYPNVMISLNMSTETKVGKITNRTDKEITIKHVSGKVFTLTHEKYALLVEKEKLALSKADILFSQKKKGIVPEILDYHSSRRQEVRKELNVLKAQYNKLLNKETDEAKALKNYMSRLDAKQLCIKVFINSIYGFFGNKNASFGDDDIASSITLTGQATIKHSNELLMQYIRSRIPEITEDELTRCIVYNDTDSSYVSIKSLVDRGLLKFKDGDVLSAETYATVKEIDEYLNKGIKIWGASELGSIDCRFIFKREVIAEVGVFIAKKRYILHMLDDEGTPCNKFKYTGIAVVRSTMPGAIKPHVKRIIETMMKTQSQTETNKVINEIYEIFMKLRIEDIAFVSNVNKLEEWASKCNGFKAASGMPFHAKSAHIYNLLVDRFKIGSTHEKIASGDKVRFFRVKSNGFGVKSVGYKNYYPEEFKAFLEIDFGAMFDSHVFSVVEGIYENVNWETHKPGAQVQTSLFDLFA